MSAITGPIPPYSNPPIQPQNFNPSQFFISNISLGIQTTVTTTVNHNYVIGQLIRIIIPLFSGCREINEQTGYVLSIPSPNQVVLDIDSSNATPFATTTQPQQPQILAIGDANNGIVSSTGRSLPSTTIPGAFINVSN